MFLPNDLTEAFQTMSRRERTVGRMTMPLSVAQALKVDLTSPHVRLTHGGRVVEIEPAS